MKGPEQDFMRVVLPEDGAFVPKPGEGVVRTSRGDEMKGTERKFLRLVLPASDGKPGLQSAGGTKLLTVDGQPVHGLIAVQLETSADKKVWTATLKLHVNVSGEPT